jgi:hypothetical protein
VEISGILERMRMSSLCRVTPTFCKIELSWVRTVVICTPEAAAMSRSVFPARSAIASRLSAGDKPKNSASSLSEGVRASGSRAFIDRELYAERRHSQHIAHPTTAPSNEHACNRGRGFPMGGNGYEPSELIVVKDPIAVSATAGSTSLPFTSSSILNPLLAVVPVGMWANSQKSATDRSSDRQ